MKFKTQQNLLARL